MINGVLDGFLPLKNPKFLTNIEDIYIGGHPGYSDECDIKASLGALKLYTRELKMFEI